MICFIFLLEVSDKVIENRGPLLIEIFKHFKNKVQTNILCIGWYSLYKVYFKNGNSVDYFLNQATTTLNK